MIQNHVWTRGFHGFKTVLTVFAFLAGLASVQAKADTLLSQGKTATASSTESSSYPASYAVDGSTSTRWASAFSDPQWIYVDLGSTCTISSVKLVWEAAYGKSFQIQTSSNASAWTSIYSTTSGTGGTQTLTVSGSGRYVRMYGTARGTSYGYSLYEFQVYGTNASSGSLLSQGKTATASSTESSSYPASYAVDGSATTRWSSVQGTDPQWIYVDLGSTCTISQVVLNWEAAYAKSYQIQTSSDASTWTSIYSTTSSTGGLQTLTVSGSGRYVRMYGTARGTSYGYSLYEFQVYGTSGGSTNCTAAPSVPTGLAASSVTSSSLSLSWGASSVGSGCSLTGYKVYRNGTLVASPTTNSVAISGLTASTTYSFTVASVDGYGTSAQSSALSVTTAAATGHNMEIRTWCPPYNQSVWQAALNTNTGGTYSPKNVLTSVAAQHWHTNTDGTVFLAGPSADVSWLSSYCQTNGIKFMVCVTNYNDNKSPSADFDWPLAVSAFANHESTLINSILSQVNTWNADGVDIDYESTGELTDRTQFATFIKDLGTQLHAMNKTLTVAIFPNDDCAPAYSWMGDWVGYVDGVESMGYGALAGGGSASSDDDYWDSTYKGQQNGALAAGYKCYQFCMGMPGDAGTWGKGGLGTSLSAHLQELQSGNYNSLPTSICIWDADFSGSGWLSANTWTQLHNIRATVHE